MWVPERVDDYGESVNRSAIRFVRRRRRTDHAKGGLDVGELYPDCAVTKALVIQDKPTGRQWRGDQRMRGTNRIRQMLGAHGCGIVERMS